MLKHIREWLDGKVERWHNICAQSISIYLVNNNNSHRLADMCYLQLIYMCVFCNIWIIRLKYVSAVFE